MCGIAGFFDPRGFASAEAERLARSMAAKVRHRGPDDSGVWVDGKSGIALAHQRLSVLDLSAAGNQPMKSPSRRYVMVYNGEIYNHLELREQLEGVAWCGHSDTETLLAAIDAWGVGATLKKCVGMLAFALWHRRGDRRNPPFLCQSMGLDSMIAVPRDKIRPRDL